MSADEMKWHRVAEAARFRLTGFGGDIDGAVEALSGLEATKPELMKAIAYLALQANTYRNMADLDSALVVTQMRGILRNYDEARERASRATGVVE